MRMRHVLARVLVRACMMVDKAGRRRLTGLDEAIAAARAIVPRRVLLVGMTCSIGDHHMTNRMLRRLLTHPKVRVPTSLVLARLAARAPVPRNVGQTAQTLN
jgi:DNA-binding transcriptional LysR family regulator